MITIAQLSIDPTPIAKKVGDFITRSVESAHLSGTVVAVSGGIDSAVALSATVKALGKSKVKAITLPESDITPPEDIEDVMYLCDSLHVTCERVDITPMLRVMWQNIPVYRSDARVPNGNLKARLRMALTYYYANSRNSLVIGTSNKTEFHLGYFTKYGDGGVDIMPLADLHKCQVRQLGKYLGVPEQIVNKPASPRLWAGHETEREIGLDYDSLDLIVYAHAKGLNNTRVAEETGLNRTQVDRIVSMIASSAHKRRLPAILKLS
jgi:NAD+ synthase